MSLNPSVKLDIHKRCVDSQYSHQSHLQPGFYCPWLRESWVTSSLRGKLSSSWIFCMSSPPSLASDRTFRSPISSSVNCRRAVLRMENGDDTSGRHTAFKVGFFFKHLTILPVGAHEVPAALVSSSLWKLLPPATACQWSRRRWGVWAQGANTLTGPTYGSQTLRTVCRGDRVAAPW